MRTLLNDYITDEQQGATSGRNPISSINEVLREGRYSRDKSRVRKYRDIALFFDLNLYSFMPFPASLPFRRYRFEANDEDPTGT